MRHMSQSYMLCVPIPDTLHALDAHHDLHAFHDLHACEARDQLKLLESKIRKMGDSNMDRELVLELIRGYKTCKSWGDVIELAEWCESAWAMGTWAMGTWG